MRIIKLKNKTWLILNVILTCIYLWWRAVYTLPLEYGIVSIIAGVSLFVVELLGAFEASVHYFNMHNIENYELPQVPEEKFPHVDVFIATYSEPSKLLHKTINGCLHMDYPDKSKVHIYLCDDSRRPEIKELAAKMGVNYLDREDNKGAKAGNLNHAMSVTDSPLIVTFDADMIPTHDFLMKTVPYFVDAEIKNEKREEKDKVRFGFVQTPQSFYNPDLFQFNLFSEGRIPNEQDYFYKDIQVSRNKTNSVIYGGSNTVLSRAALEDIGGFYTEAITEDFATGILLQKKKYRCIAINEVLASGLSPTDLKSLIQQRIRWARGVIATGRKMHILLSKKLTIGQKVNYWASVWYWYAPFKRFIYIMSPILFAVFGYMVMDCNLLEVLIFWLPMYVTSNICLKMLSRNIRTTKWTGIYETVIFPFMMFPVLFETLGISLKKFKVTQKGELEDEKGKNIAYTIPFIVLIALSVIGIFNCVVLMFDGGSLDPIVLVFWLVANLFGLVMSFFFVMGRSVQRKSERVTDCIDCCIEDSIETIQCKTNDFSETGLAVNLDRPTDIDDMEDVSISLNTDRYHVQLKGKVVHVDKKKNCWKYAFAITDMCDSFDEYLQMLYDRVPTLPKNLDESSSSFDDLKLNIEKRRQEVFYENRKLARIWMNTIVESKDGERIRVMNYNYKFIALKISNQPEKIILEPMNGLELECSYERVIRQELKLYKIDNYDEIHHNGVKRSLLENWIANVKEVPEEEAQLEETKEAVTGFEEMEHI